MPYQSHTLRPINTGFDEKQQSGELSVPFPACVSFPPHVFASNTSVNASGITTTHVEAPEADNLSVSSASSSSASVSSEAVGYSECPHASGVECTHGSRVRSRIPPSKIPGHPIIPPPSSYHERGTFGLPKQRGKGGGAVNAADAGQNDRLTRYIQYNFDVRKLDDMNPHLWWAGRPGTQRSLHHQRMMRREIYPTEDPSLHLVWVERSGQIYLKPLPAWLLNYDFFKAELCKDPKVHGLALGFLRSYTRLIRTPLDFKIADELRLLPDKLKWEQWSALADEIDIKDSMVDKRYIYGELRLGRLNHIRRYLYWGDHYHSVYVTYDQFFSKNFAWLLLVVVYLSVILAAMQVVLSTNRVTGAFADSSYWFSVASIMVLAATTAAMALIFVVLFIYHLICTIINLERKQINWVGKRFMPTRRKKRIILERPQDINEVSVAQSSADTTPLSEVQVQ
ncbi:hypothetical protein EDC01DRAFT_522887 [Geopyxis carbonaria]|nr:hypothetical protein EDC01DRAFT_522887 [Geopyxis carbonaria]